MSLTESRKKRREGAMPQTNILKEQVELNVADGTTMWAYTARPNDGNRHPGLLVLQEAFGVNGHIRNVGDRFAAEGFSVIAPEVFHRTAPAHFEASYTDFSAVRPHLDAVKPEKAELDLRAAYEWLHANSSVDAGRIASVGFCVGGRLSFVANSILPLTAAVSF
jgi:carboxymethylenebutenolidase